MSRSMKTVLLIWWMQFFSLCFGLNLPKFFQDDMVLQKEPLSAHIWGHTDDLVNPIYANITCQSGFNEVYIGDILGNSQFSIEVGPISEGQICTVAVFQGADTIVLRNVLFGDIWICSGQSNMELRMNFIFNSTEEIAYSAEYTNIRMYKVNEMTSSEEQEDLMEEEWEHWIDSSDSELLGTFSAVCHLFARSISEKIGKKPFGLIETCWGGSRVEAWSPPESLEACSIEPHVDEVLDKRSNSYLYNAMLHPFIKMSIKGVLWYQGEANEIWNRDEYACTFSEMIKSWRNRWNQNSPSDPLFPFGFAQLASYREDFPGYSVPIIRWHQTYNYGFAPNPVLQNTFMAVTLDTHDPQNGLHPQNKQVVGERLSVSGLNIAYGMTEYPTNGPFKTDVTFGPNFAHITYDQNFTYNPLENSGFYSCNVIGGADQCDFIDGSWTLISTDFVSQMGPNELQVILDVSATGLAYLWNESPILATKAAPIYAEDQYALPGAPWKTDIIFH